MTEGLSREELKVIRDLARWDGPDAAPKRMHEIWQKLNRLIENHDWASSLKQAEPPSQPAESTIDRARRAWESWKIPGVEKWISRLTHEECMAIDNAVIEFWAGFAVEYRVTESPSLASTQEDEEEIH